MSDDEKEPELICLFDLDGTLADFDGAMREQMRLLASPGEVDFYPIEQDIEPVHITFRRRMIKRQPGFWRNLLELPSGFEVLRIAISCGFKIAVLTKAPKKNFNAWSEKVEWVHKHLPVDEAGIIVNLVEDKGLVYGKVLVDDYPPYINRWLKWRPRGWVVMPDQPWNQNFEHPQVFRLKKDWTLDDMRFIEKVFKNIAAGKMISAVVLG